MVILEIRNEDMNLSKRIDATNYTQKEMCKTFAVYMKAGFGVYVAQGIDEILNRSMR